MEHRTDYLTCKLLLTVFYFVALRQVKMYLDNSFSYSVYAVYRL